MIRPALAMLAAMVAAPTTMAREPAMVVVTRGPDATAFGSCVPSLIAANRSEQPVDYVQVELEFALRDGRAHRLEFKSAYRHGIARPVPPGESRPLAVHADESQPMKAPCKDIVGIRVIDAICESGGRACTAPVSVDVDRQRRGK